MQEGESTRNAFGHQIAKVRFLLIGENIGRVRTFLDRWRKGAVLLSPRRDGQSQRTQEAMENSSHNSGIRA